MNLITPEAQESLERKPSVIILHGQHNKAERIAQLAAESLPNSSVSLDTELNLIEYPKNLCYVDAMEAANKRVPPDSPKFRETYEKERAERLIRGRSFLKEISEAHPESIVIDLHETRSETGVIPEEGLDITLNVSEEQIERLKDELDDAFPPFKDRAAVNISRPGNLILEGKERSLPLPNNCVIIEIFTDPDLYSSLTTDVSSIGLFAESAELRRIKKENSREVNQEINKYRRLLEIYIPVIARFMQKKLKTKN